MNIINQLIILSSNSTETRPKVIRLGQSYHWLILAIILLLIAVALFLLKKLIDHRHDDDDE